MRRKALHCYKLTRIKKDLCLCDEKVTPFLLESCRVATGLMFTGAVWLRCPPGSPS